MGVKIVVNEDLLEKVSGRAISKGKRIIVPLGWYLRNAFAFPVEAHAVDEDGSIKKIPLYWVEETIYGTLKHDPFISTVFKDCKIGKGEGLSLREDTCTDRAGRKKRFKYVRKTLPDGRILDVKDVFWTWIVVAVGSRFNGFTYRKFEDFAQRRILELGFTEVVPDADEGLRRMFVAWFTALSIALGMIKLVIPKDFYIPVGRLI